jgi:hypothetical protein
MAVNYWTCLNDLLPRTRMPHKNRTASGFCSFTSTVKGSIALVRDGLTDNHAHRPNEAKLSDDYRERGSLEGKGV